MDEHALNSPVTNERVCHNDSSCWQYILALSLRLTCMHVRRSALDEWHRSDVADTAVADIHNARCHWKRCMQLRYFRGNSTH